MSANKARTKGNPPAPKKPLTHPVKAIRAGDAALVARLRKICMALPEAGERPSHGEPTWFAGKGKVFATLDNHHHGSAHLSVWLPQPLGGRGARERSRRCRFTLTTFSKRKCAFDESSPEPVSRHLTRVHERRCRTIRLATRLTARTALLVQCRGIPIAGVYEEA